LAIHAAQFKKKFGSETGCAKSPQFGHGTFAPQTMDNFVSAHMPWQKERAWRILRTIADLRAKTARDGTFAPMTNN
jgi:hypothetical protein